MDLQHFLDLLKSRRPFSFLRLGDGDWEAILWNWPPGRPPANCDGARYSPEMRREFIRLLKLRPDYYIGSRFGERLAAAGRQWIEDNQLQDLKWCNSGVWAQAMLDGRLAEVIGSLAGRPLYLIGPQHLAEISTTLPGLPIKWHLITDPARAFEQRGGLLEQCLAKIGNAPPAAVWCFCCGPATKILIDRLHQHTGGSCTLVDFGSLFDGLAGHMHSRTHFTPATIRQHFALIREWRTNEDRN